MIHNNVTVSLLSDELFRPSCKTDLTAGIKPKIARGFLSKSFFYKSLYQIKVKNMLLKTSANTNNL